MSYQQITPLEDPILRKLVLFVADFLNQRWSQPVVKHTEIYDAFGVPHDSFPFLKVYRRYTRASLENSQRDTEITLAYCLLNVQISQTPAIANWIDINAREALRQFKFNNPGLFDIDNSISCRYRTILQLGEIVYQIELDFTLSNESNTACLAI
jgi:hypothetical protein